MSKIFLWYLYTIFLICLSDKKNSSDNSLKLLPSMSRPLRISLSLSECTYSLMTLLISLFLYSIVCSSLAVYFSRHAKETREGSGVPFTCVIYLLTKKVFHDVDNNLMHSSLTVLPVHAAFFTSSQKACTLLIVSLSQTPVAGV